MITKPPKNKKHSWDPQNGFRKDECSHCQSTRIWDQERRRIVYYKANGDGPFFWAPPCLSVLINGGKKP